MSRDDIIRMAREVGLRVGTNVSGVTLVGSPAGVVGINHLTIDELERFSALIAAAAKAEEREACAKVCESMGAFDAMDGEAIGSAAMVRVIDRAHDLCAAAIRARGDA